MKKRILSARTAAQKSTTDEANNVNPQLQQCNVSGSATISGITTDEITTDTTIWKGGYVTDNFHSYYLDENMVKHYR